MFEPDDKHLLYPTRLLTPLYAGFFLGFEDSFPYIFHSLFWFGLALAHLLITLFPQINASIDNTADFSAAGPTVDGRWKPDIVAPGVDVLSAVTPEFLKLSRPTGAGMILRLIVLSAANVVVGPCLLRYTFNFA